MVYLHQNKLNDEIFYVGMGKNKRPNNMVDRNPYWKNYVKKYGLPSVIIYRKNISQLSARKIEIKLIKKYKRKQDGGTLVNITKGGEDNPMNHPELRNKVSIAMKGRVFNEETRLKMSLSAKKRGFSDGLRKSWDNNRKNGMHGMVTKEARDKFSKTTKGIKRSDSHKIKNGIAHSKKVIQKTLDGGIVKTFKSQRDAAIAVGCTAANIGMCVGGKTLTAKGFIWCRG